MKHARPRFSAICRTNEEKIQIVPLGAHQNLVMARKHAEETIGGTDKMRPLAIVPQENAEKTARRWR